GISFSSHCHFKISLYTVGQGVTGQLGYLESSCEPGIPENVLTTGTSIISASLTVLMNVSCDFLAWAFSGDMGLSWQLNALIVNPRECILSRYSLRLSLFLKSSSK